MLIYSQLLSLFAFISCIADFCGETQRYKTCPAAVYMERILSCSLMDRCWVLCFQFEFVQSLLRVDMCLCVAENETDQSGVVLTTTQQPYVYVCLTAPLTLSSYRSVT